MSRLEHGENVLTPPRRQSMWRLYLEKYQDPMVRILLVAAVVSLVLSFVKNDYIETIGIIAAVILATTVGFYFERDAARKFDVLTQLGEEQRVKVIRSVTPNSSLTPNSSPTGEGNYKGEESQCQVMEIPRREVVVGDIVIIETGDEVPADGTLFEATDLQVDESSLTGEPLTTKSLNHQKVSAYPSDLLLRSSMVMNGTGRYVVTAVGDETEIGHVARQATEITGVKTPLNMQLDRLAKFISKVGSAVSIAAFLVFLVHDVLTQPLWHTDDYVGMAEVVLKYFMMAVTLIVMAVPEGLPMAVTLALALNMRRMLKSNNLVRKLQASETMGAVTCICTDKTGTLTENRMTVVDVRRMKDDRRCDLAIALNTTATHDVGNPTEQALLRWLQEQGVDYQQLRNEHSLTSRLPFSTERKYMSTTVGDTVYIKGAPEVVMDMCDLTTDEREKIQKQLLEWQQHAMRTLAIAQDKTLLAIVAISDPLRKEVPAAIRQCERAGIDVKIVTGDTAQTAMEIARQTGVLTEQLGNNGIITGAEFAALSDEEALKVIRELKVMSRARPTDKQRLVSLLQQQGEVVAVTGDGTNDAPALNRAHVGLSLGSGTSVAKEASDITLIDDSFRSIVQAVMWGRSLYKNLQRFIFFQLVVNVAALLLVVAGSVIGTELPLTVTQILWVNLIMDTFAAMALASLPPDQSVLKDKPRARDAFIITKDMARRIFGAGLLFVAVLFGFIQYFMHYGVDSLAEFKLLDYFSSYFNFHHVGGNFTPKELSLLFTIFVFMQFWNIFNAKAYHTMDSAFKGLFDKDIRRGFGVTILIIALGQVLIISFGGEMFNVVPLPLSDWVRIIIGTSLILWLGEIERWVHRVKKAKR